MLVCPILYHENEDVLKKLKMVPRAGLEPAQSFPRRILSPLRLPIPPPGHGSEPLYVVLMEAEPGIEPRSTALQAAA